MLSWHVRLLEKKLKQYFTGRGLHIERDDAKYLVFRGLDYCLVHPKMKRTEFITFYIVEYDEHIVNKTVYGGILFMKIYKKIIRNYNKYINR